MDESRTSWKDSTLDRKSVDLPQDTSKPQSEILVIQELIDSFQGESAETEEEQKWAKSIESECKSALQHFHMRSKILGSILTPNAVILKFQGDETLTVEQVKKRQSEFLTTHRVNIINARAESGAVSLTIPRPNRRILNFLEVWKTWKPDCLHGNHELLIGVREEDGGHLFLSPARHSPHTLIAGATGSGKSVLMQNIILSIVCTNTRNQAQLILIDPKQGVDYFAFESIPHLQGGRIITSSEESISTLSQLIEIMNVRYAMLRQNRVSNFFELNKRVSPADQIPVLWVIHDEFATWMMTDEYKTEVSNIVGRLGVQARAAGIFLIFAAQRPDVNVMPVQLRDNLGNRLVLRVASEGTSEIALGEKGAERLLGKGHLAAKLEGENDIVFGQVPFIDTGELERIVMKIRLS